MYNTNKISGTWIGKEKEHRKAYRRKTIAHVVFSGDTGFSDNAELHAFDLSLDGALLVDGTVPPLGSHVNEAVCNG
ncbi:MAG: hypothetical protein ABFR31_07975 [Thermodesulfobacteriota bacterium]